MYCLQRDKNATVLEVTESSWHAVMLHISCKRAFFSAILQPRCVCTQFGCFANQGQPQLLQVPIDSSVLQKYFGIAKTRYYITYAIKERHEIGYNGSTFAGPA